MEHFAILLATTTKISSLDVSLEFALNSPEFTFEFFIDISL